MRLRHIIAILGLVWALPAQAQIPSEIIGIWSAEGCADPDSFIIISGPTIMQFEDGAVFRFGDGFIETDIVRASDGGDGWTQLKFGSNITRRVRLDGDRLEVDLDPGAPDPAERVPQEAPEDESEDGAQDEEANGADSDAEAQAPQESAPLAPDTQRGFLERCQTAPARWQLPHGEVITFIQAQETLEATCSQADPAACIGGMIALADVTGEGALSVAEFARALRMIVHFAALVGFEDEERVATIREVEVLGAVGAAAIFAPILGRMLVSSLDYDSSNTVTLSEIMQDRQAAELAGTFGAQTFRRSRQNIERAVESLGGLQNLLDLLGQ